MLKLHYKRPLLDIHFGSLSKREIIHNLSHKMVKNFLTIQHSVLNLCTAHRVDVRLSPCNPKVPLIKPLFKNFSNVKQPCVAENYSKAKGLGPKD